MATEVTRRTETDTASGYVERYEHADGSAFVFTRFTAEPAAEAVQAAITYREQARAAHRASGYAAATWPAVREAYALYHAAVAAATAWYAGRQRREWAAGAERAERAWQTLQAQWAE